MVENFFSFMIQYALIPSAVAMLAAWISARGRLIFPIFWGSRIWLFVQAWAFYTVALMLFASLGKVAGLPESFQQVFAEFLAPFLATVVFLRFRMWPKPGAPK